MGEQLEQSRSRGGARHFAGVAITRRTWRARRRKTAAGCAVVGCDSPAVESHALNRNQERLDAPAHVPVCTTHCDELADPDTEWLLERDTGQLYVGASLRDLNEYVVCGSPLEITTYGAAREYSHTTADGVHIPLRVHRRGDAAKDIMLVLPNRQLIDAFKYLGETLH